MLNKLTETAIRKSKYPEKKQIADGGGLYLRLRSSGSKKFEFRYKRPATGKQNWLLIGSYPDTSLKEAREKARELRKLIKEGKDPQGTENERAYSFGEIAQAYLDSGQHKWSDSHYRTTKLRYDNYIHKPLAHHDIRNISSLQIFQLLEMVAQSGSYQTAEKLSYIFKGIFDRAVILGIVDLNPAQGLMAQVTKTKKEKQLAHFNLNQEKDREQFGKFLKDIDELKRTSVAVKLALQLSPYVFMRPANLAGLRKDQIDLEGRMIEIESENMKSEHSSFLVPLSDQALEIIKKALMWSANGDYIFTSRKHRLRPITTNSLSTARKRIGWTNEHITIHGLRHTATTWLSEQGYNFEATELQLHHKLTGIRGTYNKAEYLPERRKMMQDWANFIDSLKD